MSKTIVVILLFVSSWFSGVNRTAEIRGVIDETEDLLHEEKYEELKTAYLLLKDSLNYWQADYALNLAHCSFLLARYDTAFFDYETLTLDDATLASQGYNQLALSYFYLKEGKTILQNRLVADKQKDVVIKTLDYLKLALIKDADNEAARYNFELLSMLLNNNSGEQENQDQNSEDQNKDNQDNQDKDNQNQDNQDKDNQNQQQNQQQNQDQQGDKDKDNQSQQDKQEGEGGDQQQNGENKEQKTDDKQQASDAGSESKEGESGENQSELSKKEQAQMQEEEIRKRLMESNMSKEKAEQLLKSYEQQQIKYLQQKKKSDSNPDKNNKPQW